MPMSQQELVAIAKRLDANADGLIDYYEFSKLIDLETTEMYVPVLELSVVSKYRCALLLLCLWHAYAWLVAAEIKLGIDCQHTLHQPLES